MPSTTLKTGRFYFSKTTFMSHDNCFTDDKQNMDFEIDTPSDNNWESRIIYKTCVTYTEGEISRKCNICDRLQE